MLLADLEPQQNFQKKPDRQRGHGQRQGSWEQEILLTAPNGQFSCAAGMFILFGCILNSSGVEAWEIPRLLASFEMNEFEFGIPVYFILLGIYIFINKFVKTTNHLKPTQLQGINNH